MCKKKKEKKISNGIIIGSPKYQIHWRRVDHVKRKKRDAIFFNTKVQPGTFACAGSSLNFAHTIHSVCTIHHSLICQCSAFKEDTVKCFPPRRNSMRKRVINNEAFSEEEVPFLAILYRGRGTHNDNVRCFLRSVDADHRPYLPLSHNHWRALPSAYVSRRHYLNSFRRSARRATCPPLWLFHVRGEKWRKSTVTKVQDRHSSRPQSTL